MRWAVLLGLCGCNPVFGLESTELIPAQRPDAAPPPSCPVIGGIPKFRPELTQVPAARKCWGFGVDEEATIAAALCPDTDPLVYNPTIASGTVTTGLARMPMVPATADLSTVKVTPEGTVFGLKLEVDGNGLYSFIAREYTFADEKWTQGGTSFRPPLPTSGTYSFSFSNPTRAPNRRIIATYTDPTYEYLLGEFVWDGTAWSEAWHEPFASYLTPELYSLSDPTLTPDGLHLVFSAQSSLVMGGYGSGYYGSGYGGGSGTGPGVEIQYGNAEQPLVYFDRGSVNERFIGPPRVIDSVPGGVTYPHITENCERIYFTALDTVWYVEYAYE